MILKRLFSLSIDYFIIVCYAGILLGISLLIQGGNAESMTASPMKGQLIGFVSLTLPVFLYFFLCEKSARKATVGKYLNRLMVGSTVAPTAKTSQIFIRNLLKLLPWEIAHTGVHWLMYYSNNNQAIPVWVYVLMIVPQIIIVWYFVILLITKGAACPYDRLAKTKMVIRGNG